MIGRLGELMQDAHTAASLGSSREYSEPELFLAHSLRAGESEDNASVAYLFESAGIDPLITTQRVAKRRTMFGECRRVEYYQIVLILTHVVEILECVFGECLVPVVVWKVQGYIGFGQRYSLGR